MEYVALYRKYRPQTFDDVIGQDHIINTLRNQILNDKVSHAYLFTGTRGTGKTSTAKIFARAVNCIDVKSHNGNPCGKCTACNSSTADNIDIIEMDAASNNGVDYARDIREKVQYPPVNGKYKVYIIDEVHMLSQGAFNALLKTLEEPPKHAMFILCTTEVHKIPATILSRCMRFDFRLVPTETLAKHIASIYDKENKLYDLDAVNAIAQAGEGSVRDSVSIADRCFSATTGKLTYGDVMGVLGVSSKENISLLARAVLTNEPSNILVEINNLVNEGKDVARLSKDLSLYIKDLLTVKLCTNAKEMLCVPQEEFAKLQEIANLAETPKMLYAIDVLVGLENNLRYALSPLMLLEASCLKIASSSGNVDAEGLDRRVARLEQLPQNINNETKQLYVVDPTKPQSVWYGVKLALDKLDQPLLVGVWQDVSIEFVDDKLKVICTKGAYLLIETQYKKDLLKEIAKFTDKAVVFVEPSTHSQLSEQQQLNNLGNNVVFTKK